ncbi:hypothetical protein EBR56_06470 [bacterium]|nr:hypothetical protein [bacterium]
MLMLALVLSVAGTAMAQQVTVVQPQAVRAAQPTRSYRSYSVAPSTQAAATMGDVRPTGRHAGEASWRHATAKAAGHYRGGR